MAKAVAFVVCILALATFAHCHTKKFDVEGQVYCDPCRVEFQTRLSSPIVGATVRLECWSREHSENVTYSVEGVTDISGHYSLTVEGDHEDEICEVMAVKSPKEDCNVPFELYERAKISCTDNNGVSGAIRIANSLGFMSQNAAPECKKALEELGLFPLA